MQLYAYDKDLEAILAHCADKGKDYFCMECGGIVRTRSGSHRQPHFFHLSPPTDCKQVQKSLTHLQIQWKIQQILPQGECFLERHFRSIHRIADIVWENQKIIFEVQCSPITAQEVEERNRDYSSEGYSVVWLLHDQRFRQWKVSAAEHFLYEKSHYYTNINPNGDGMIYDCFDVIIGGIRRKKLPRLPIDISKIRLIPERKKELLKQFPGPLKNKIEHSLFSFKDDLMDLFDDPLRKERWEAYLKLFSQENLVAQPKKSLNWLRSIFVRPYRLLFDFFLQQACD